jgi:hypothetical protein
MKKNKLFIFLFPAISIKNHTVSWIVNKLIMPIAVIGVIIGIYFIYIFYGLTKIDKIENSTIYINEDNIQLKEYVMKVVDTSMLQLRQNGIEIKSNNRIVFCATVDKYNRNTFYLSKGSLGSNQPIFNVLTIGPADYKNNLQEKYENGLIPRKVSDVITHELTHSYIKRQLGIFKYSKLCFLYKWKNEGFCEYVANSSSFNIQDGKRIFVENGEEQEKIESNKDIWYYTYFYFKSRLKTDYLFSYKHISFDDFFSTDFNEETLENEIKEKLLSGEYVFNKQ